VELRGLKDVSKMTREEGWRYDLAILAREAHRKGFNLQLDVHRPVSREAFDAQVHELHDAIPGLSDGQIVLRLAKLMVFLEDGHSAVWPTGTNPLFRAALPLQFFWFEEGLFVTAADPAHRDLLGAQVVAFDGRPSAEVLRAAEPFIPRDRGNPMFARAILPFWIRTLSVMHAAGLTRNPDRVTLTIRDRSRATRALTLNVDETEPNIWNKLPAPASWQTFAATLEKPPLYLRNMDRPQWFEYLPEHKAVYFGFNRVLDAPKETLAQFTERLMKFIDDHEVAKLIIDMRWNNGGNTALAPPLVLALAAQRKVNQRGRLFVVIGRRTFSAAQNTATYLERYTEATFIGEPTGSSPNFVGEEWPITLPYSKVMANVSHLTWQSSWPADRRMWLAPEIYVPPTFADFSAGRDPALSAIWEYKP
jgi:hypothetical protein